MKYDFLNSEKRKFTSIRRITVPRIFRHIAFFIIFFIIASFVFLTFVPWIQTAGGSGTITTLNPHDRTQNITALVSGRIKEWYVREGDSVKAGDPILEIIDNDENLLERITIERDAYRNNLTAAQIAEETAKLNYDRQKRLFAQGLASKLSIEKAKINYKKLISEKQKALAQFKQTESKLSRQKTQRITAPIDGRIIRITAGNLATSIKQGDNIAVLVPDDMEKVAEIYVNGVDAALVREGQKVRLQFEGWPVIQFSGWPSLAIGTFGGVVASIDPTVSDSGKFRVLVKPDPEQRDWPDSRFLRYGWRANGWVLMGEVPVGYELWRQLNAFPPEYPHDDMPKEEKAK